MTPDTRQLLQRLTDLEQRVARLETALAPTPPVLASDASNETAAVESPETLSLQAATGLSGTRMVFLLGRSIMVLAGAFLLRFITESGVVPPGPGFTLGLVYGLALIGLANRTGRQQPAEGSVHGLTAVLVAYPFLYESIVTLHLVGPVSGGLALALVSAAGLLTAWQRGLRPLAWAFTLPALLLCVVLGFATDRPVFYGGLLLGLGAGTVLLAYSRGWHLKRWLVAGMANLIVLRLAVMAADQAAGSSQGDLPVGGVKGLCFGLLAIYLGMFVFRALVQGRGARVFDVCQSAAVLLIGFGGALRLTEASGGDAQRLGLWALCAAAAGYTLAFTVMRQRHGRGRGFFFFATLGLAFLLLSSRAVAHGNVLSGTWLVLGLIMAGLGSRFDRVTLRTHSVVYLLFASLQAGLLISSLDALFAGGNTDWHQPGVMGYAVLATTVATAVILNRLRGARESGRWRMAPRLLAVLLALPGLVQVTINGLISLLGSVPPDAAPPLLAAIRTGVLSCLAVGIATAARRDLLRPLRWLVYPVLGLGLAKVVVEDLRLGHPLGLFFAFGMIGGALILAPRMLRRREPKDAPAAAAEFD